MEEYQNLEMAFAKDEIKPKDFFQGGRIKPREIAKIESYRDFAGHIYFEIEETKGELDELDNAYLSKLPTKTSTSKRSRNPRIKNSSEYNVFKDIV